MTNNCPYCGSELRNEQDNYFCDFCDMSVPMNDVQLNGRRRYIPFEVNHMYLADAEQNTQQLMQRPTNDLILLLRLVRQKRTEYYNYLRVMNKANEQVGGFSEHAKLTGKDYEYWTRKAWVLENIIRERAVVYPERITDDYLLSMSVRADRINDKPMKIRVKKQVKSDMMDT